MKIPFALQLALLASVLVSGCATELIRNEAPLPFHVALIPATIVAGAAAPEVAGASVLKDTKLAFDSAEVTRQVDAALSKDCVTRVTVLSYGDDVTREQFLAKYPSETERDEYWDREVTRIKPDLVGKLKLSFSETVLTDTNGTFWANLPLFLIGGPFCYFFDDRDYYSTASLSLWLYDASPIAIQQASLARGDSELTNASPRADLTDLDFIDRADGIGAYALSVLIPAGWLAKDTNKVKESLEREILARLTTTLKTEIRLRANELTRADGLYDFYIRSDEMRVVASGADSFELRGEVFLETYKGTPRMEDFTFSLDDQAIAASFGEPSLAPGQGAGRVESYPFVIPLAGNDLPSEVRVVFRDGSQNNRERSYTFNARAIEAAFRTK
ncbi:MAG: hypothetical protein ACI8X5_003614 [Planctomycetota bacterium]|jgi:hypothetical protein